MPKQPLSSYFLFSQEERLKVKAENPSYSICECAKELGRRWAVVSPEAKQRFQQMAEQAGDFWIIGETIEVNPGQIAPSKKDKPSRRRLNLTDGSEKPLGEWNKMRIVTTDNTVEVYVNNTLVQKGWNASTSEGAICLQAEGANVQFRSIRIKE